MKLVIGVLMILWILVVISQMGLAYKTQNIWLKPPPIIGCPTVMKRMVVTGLACPSEPWVRFLGEHPDQRIITFREVLRYSSSCDPREMSRYITQKLDEFRPESLICHDLGVPLSLLSLLRLNRKGICTQTRVTLFNGAFRRVNLLKANHPFRVQIMGVKKAIKEIKSHGGKVDYQLAQYLPKVRAMFRMIILYGFTEKIGSLIGLDELVGFSERQILQVPVQIIASRNDPYIPFDSILQLKKDINPRRFVVVEYGHFPYTLNRQKLVPLIEEFEADCTPSTREDAYSLDSHPSRILL